MTTFGIILFWFVTFVILVVSYVKTDDMVEHISNKVWKVFAGAAAYILIFVIFFSQYPLKFFMTDYTFGLSIGKAAVISVSLFAAAYIIQLIGMKYTYKKGVKIVETEPQNIVGNIKMG